MTNMTNPVTKQVLYVLCISVCITEIALLIVPLTASPSTSANFSQYGWLSVGGTLGILVALYLGGIVKNLNKQIPFFQKLKYLFYKSIPGFMVLMPVVLLSYMHIKYNEILIKKPRCNFHSCTKFNYFSINRSNDCLFRTNGS